MGKMVKASSLYYAIMICVLVSICCSIFLLLNHYSRIHSTIMETKMELLYANTSAKNYFLGKVNVLEDRAEELDVFDNGIRSYAKVYPWGSYKVYHVSSYFKNDTIKQDFLIGQRGSGETALYLVDNGKPLHMVGKAKIYGNAYLPKSGIKRGYTSSQSFSSRTFLMGEKRISKRQSLRLDKSFGAPENLPEPIPLEDNGISQEIYNDFDKEPVVVMPKDFKLDNKKISGNVIVQSKDSLFIEKNNTLEDIIILAPKVVFERGFKGTVHVKANRLVMLQEGVVLTYPSTIFLDAEKTKNNEVILQERSKLLGTITLVETAETINGNNGITIEPKAEVIGHVHCEGKIQLKGKITGSTVTRGFILKNKASTFDNYIEDGVVDVTSLSKEFLGQSTLPIYAKNEKKYGIVKEL